MSPFAREGFDQQLPRFGKDRAPVLHLKPFADVGRKAPPLVAVVSKPLGGESALGLAQGLVGVVVSLLSVWGFWLAMRRAPGEPTFQKDLDLPVR